LFLRDDEKRAADILPSENIEIREEGGLNGDKSQKKKIVKKVKKLKGKEKRRSSLPTEQVVQDRRKSEPALSPINADFDNGFDYFDLALQQSESKALFGDPLAPVSTSTSRVPAIEGPKNVFDDIEQDYRQMRSGDMVPVPSTPTVNYMNMMVPSGYYLPYPQMYASTVYVPVTTYAPMPAAAPEPFIPEMRPNYYRYSKNQPAAEPSTKSVEELLKSDNKGPSERKSKDHGLMTMDEMLDLLGMDVKLDKKEPRNSRSFDRRVSADSDNDGEVEIQYIDLDNEPEEESKLPDVMVSAPVAARTQSVPMRNEMGQSRYQEPRVWRSSSMC